jgi:hypothetical protein
MKIFLKILRSALIFTLFSSFAVAEQSGQEFSVATHYYGLKEYSWPINYLNAIKASDIESDMLKIKEMGFNQIILLASWAEFEPTIGIRNELAYLKIESIIKSANNNGLSVAIRIPYLWSLTAKGGEDMRERIVYALLNEHGYKRKLIEFILNFEKDVIAKNSNVVMKFGSWEDYYVLRDIFFERGSSVSNLVRKLFLKDTGVAPNEVIMNGENYDIFNDWMDAKISRLSKDIGQYGYEIRTDSDLYVNDEKNVWHSHNKFYKNKSNGKVVAYWAPYFGQKNNGENISADSAVKSFSWMLDLISAETTALPFIDQLNFFDNSPNTEKNAKISSDQVSVFFDQLTDVLVERTTGYALWTIRDYRHNIVYNPAFSEGRVGWEVSDNVIFSEDGVFIPPDGQMSQYIPHSRFWVLKSKSPELIVKVVSGNGTANIGETISKFQGSGRYGNDISIEDLGEGFNITIKADANSPSGLRVAWVALQGHRQEGQVLDEAGKPGEFYNLILNTNKEAINKVNRPCRGYAKNIRSVAYTRGLFSDGWTKQDFSICDIDFNKTTGFILQYYNPVLEKRTLKISTNNTIKHQAELKGGKGEVRICLGSKKSENDINFHVSTPFIPGNLDEKSPDFRNLGVMLLDYEKINCS